MTTLQIERPELETLIHDRMSNGEFESVEDLLIWALKLSPKQENLGAEANGGSAIVTGALLIAAMQASPFKDVEFVQGGERMAVRPVEF